MHLARALTRTLLAAALAPGCRCTPMRILHTNVAIVLHEDVTCEHYGEAATDALVTIPPGVRLEVWDIEYGKDCQCFEVEYAGQRGFVMGSAGHFDEE